MVSLLMLTACEQIMLEEEELLDSYILFTPDEPLGGVPQWTYVFRDGYAEGCNAEAQYTSDDWVVYEDEDAIRVYFGSEWEHYWLRPGDADFISGDFDMDTSVGISMTGGWLRVSAAGGAPYCD